MSRHLLLAVLLAVLCVGAALAAGPDRRGALVGAVSSSATAIASLVLMRQSARSSKPVQAALVVMVGMFLVRILVVAAGTIVVARGGGRIVGYIVAFFVPYFVFAAIEGAYVHSLSRGSGSAA